MPLLAVPNVTVHPSTASVPVTVLLYNGLLVLMCPLKGYFYIILNSTVLICEYFRAITLKN